MKVNGQEATKEVVFGPLCFKRGPKQFLTFYAQPVWSYSEFDQLCPAPENKNVIFTRDGKQTDHNAPAHKHALKEHGVRRWGYYILKSLEPSHIEWDTVDLEDPKTWGLVEQELRDNLAHFEYQQLMALVDEANALDADKLAENAATFFQIADLESAAEASNPSPSGEPENIPSSGPVSDSE